MINNAVSQLKSGGIIAVPTETVYGLAADANNPRAIDRLYALKGRITQKPLAIAIKQLDDVYDYVSRVDDKARRLMKHYWPGPLTLVFPCDLPIADQVHADNHSLAMRCSSSPLLQQLLAAFDGTICLTSANPSGQRDALTAKMVKDYFAEAVYIIEDDRVITNKPSSIVDFSQTPARILREGTILAADIDKIMYTNNED